MAERITELEKKPITKKQLIELRNHYDNDANACVRGIGICKDLNPTERMQIAAMLDNIVEVLDKHIKKMDD